jgi:hypothetical protein
VPTATYDDEKEDLQQPVADGSHDDLGTSPEQRDQEVDDLENLYSAESAPKQDASTPADEKEENKLDDQVGKGYTSDSKGDEKSSKSKSSKNKRGVAGIVSVIIVTGSVGMLGILQGPFQLVHAAQLLQRFHYTSDEEFMDGRAGQLIRYARHFRNPQKRNMGMIGNKIADHYEAKMRSSGITPEYRGTRIQTLSFDMSNPKAVTALKEIEARGGTITGMENGRATVDLSVESGGTRSRRIGMKGVVKGMGLSKVSSAVGSRTMVRRAGVDFHPLKNIARTGDEKLRSYWKKRQAERNERRKNGVNADIDTDLRNPDTDPPETDAMDEGRLNSADAPKLDGKISKLAKITGAFAIVGAVCSVQQMGDSLDEMQQVLIVLPLIRMGTEVVAMGNQVMDGKDVNFDELGATATQFYDEVAEIGAKSFFSAASIQSELGEEVTGPDIPDGAKPSKEKPAFFRAIDSVVDGLTAGHGSSVCAAVNSPIGTAASYLGDGLLAFLSGGAVSAAASVVGSVVTDRFVSFFADDLVRWGASKPLAINAKGALLGNYVNYGGLLGGNENAMAHGGAALSQGQVSALKKEQEQIRLARQTQKSPFDKYLNLYDVDSLASRSLIQNPDLASPTATVASIFRAPLSIFSGFGNLISRTISPGVFAQESEPYDYGIDRYGFSQEDSEDPMLENPAENAEWVEARLSDLNGKYSKCFGTKIDPTTFAIQDTTNGEGVKYTDLKKYEAEDECGSADTPNRSEGFRRYKMYLADQYAAKSMVCYEGIDDEACEEIGFVADGGGQTGGSNGSTGTPNTGGKIVGDPYTDTTEVACAEGTRDIGVQDGYTNGVMFKVRLCSLPNLPSNGQADNPGGEFSTDGADGHAIVNSRVSGAWYSLIEAAKADGINFSVNSSFRSAGHQQKLWNKNPNSEEVARPGYSSHQAGVALDFNNMSGKKNGATCSNRATNSGAGYKWLVANAATYGFKQYAVEAWHWDALNAASRC